MPRHSIHAASDINYIESGAQMALVEIYTTTTCPYCVRAKKLLDIKGYPYREIDVSSDTKLRKSMTKKANGRTSVPQVFIDGSHIGGCDDLYALDKSGKLDLLLGNSR
jgi:glutaredoxin 3